MAKKKTKKAVPKSLTKTKKGKKLRRTARKKPKAKGTKNKWGVLNPLGGKVGKFLRRPLGK